jgi:hypothetical protein|nr:MAG TPA: hypothetical protein [Caudoviricetes sp.]
MIIDNGVLYTRSATEATPSLDPKTGYPRRAEDECWHNPIRCQFIARDYSNLTRVQGESVRLAKYEILIEEQPFTAGAVRLEDVFGGVVCEASVIEIEPLTAVGQIRILI